MPVNVLVAVTMVEDKQHVFEQHIPSITYSEHIGFFNRPSFLMLLHLGLGWSQNEGARHFK